MAIEVGNVLEGTITGITKFGAFVDLGEKQTGLVHISEVSNEYVENINDFLKVTDQVKVKVLTVEGNKISLSIKQTQPNTVSAKEEGTARNFDSTSTRGYVTDKGLRRDSFDKKRTASRSGQLSFEEKMKRFLKDSDERLTDMERNTESKRGGRGGRRG